MNIRNLIYLLLGASMWVYCSPKTLRVGVISEISLEGKVGMMLKTLKGDMDKLLGGSVLVDMREFMHIAPNSSQQTIQDSLGRIYPKIDVLLAAGPSVVRVLGSRSLHIKPTIALGIFDSELQNLPITAEKSSGLENFTYIPVYQSFKDQLREAHTVFPFKHLSVLFAPTERALFSNKEFLTKLSRDTDVTLTLQEVPEPSNIAAFKKGTDAVFVVSPVGGKLLGPSTWTSLVAQSINNQKIPSFSSTRDGVELGLMASFSNTRSLTIFSRKIALLVEDIVSGVSLKDNAVSIIPQDQAYINLNTCRRIGFYPSFELMYKSVLYENKSSMGSWSIEKILDLFYQKNIAIQSAAIKSTIADKEVQQAIGNYLPHVEASVSGVQINEERAGAFAVEKTLTGSLSLTQVLYSDKIIAGITINQWLADAQKETEKRERLDAVYSLMQSYFGVLKAQVLVEIKSRNIAASKQNLELARTKASLGESGMGDVYRYESQVANDLQSIVSAKTQEKSTVLRLAQILNLNEVETEELQRSTFVKSDTSLFSMDTLQEFVKNPQQLKAFTDFLIIESHKNTPVMSELNYTTKALERQHTMQTRSLWVPTVALQTKFDRVLARSGEGSTPTSFIPGVPASDFEDNSWSVGVGITLPLFEGTKSYTAQVQTAAQLKDLALQKQHIKNKLSLSIRTGVMDMVESSTAKIYSKIAVENAEKSFAIVQDLYKKGVASVIQLLDGQKALEQSMLAQQNAQYDYLLSFLQLEYRMGTFYSMKKPSERLVFIKRAQEYVHNMENQ
ncbi:MAG: TolC family protein [Fibrobacterales bacterium]